MLRLVVALTLIAAPAVSQDCRVIENDSDRLACYDRKAGVTPTVDETGSGNWTVTSKISEFEDTFDVYAVVLSDAPVACGSYRDPQRIALELSCVEGETSVVISTSDCHLASTGDYGRIELRSDDENSRAVRMKESSSNRALGLWNSGGAMQFIRNHLLGHQRLLIRFTPYNEDRVTASFRVASVESAVEPLREACGW